MASSALDHDGSALRNDIAAVIITLVAVHAGIAEKKKLCELGPATWMILGALKIGIVKISAATDSKGQKDQELHCFECSSQLLCRWQPPVGPMSMHDLKHTMKRRQLFAPVPIDRWNGWIDQQELRPAVTKVAANTDPREE
eukprot:scaffold312826_cov18-Tisochrysis_lutea.AAC.3